MTSAARCVTRARRAALLTLTMLLAALVVCLLPQQAWATPPSPASGSGAVTAWTCDLRTSPSPTTSPSPALPDPSPSPTTTPVPAGEDCAATAYEPWPTASAATGSTLRCTGLADPREMSPSPTPSPSPSASPVPVDEGACVVRLNEQQYLTVMIGLGLIVLFAATAFTFRHVVGLSR